MTVRTPAAPPPRQPRPQGAGRQPRRPRSLCQSRSCRGRPTPSDTRLSHPRPPARVTMMLPWPSSWVSSRWDTPSLPPFPLLWLVLYFSHNLGWRGSWWACRLLRPPLASSLIDISSDGTEHSSQNLMRTLQTDWSPGHVVCSQSGLAWLSCLLRNVLSRKYSISDFEGGINFLLLLTLGDT